MLEILLFLSKIEVNTYTVWFEQFFTVSGFAQTGSNIWLNSSVGSAWPPYFSGFFIHFSRRMVLFLWQQRTLKLLVKKFYSNYYCSVMMQTFCPNYKCAQTEFFLFFSQNRFLLFFFAFSIIFCLK